MIALVRQPLRPLPLGLVVAGGLAAVTIGAVGSLVTDRAVPLLAVLALLAVAALAYLGTWTSPALLVALATGATVFSGNDRFGLPLGVDRLLFAAAFLSMLLQLPNAAPDRRLTLRPMHALLALAATYCVLNAFAAGTLFTQTGIFGLLDKIGIMPMLAFTLAPRLFGTPTHRDLLLRVLVGVGAYLGVTAIGEAFDLHFLVWPKYILDPTVGLHFDRVRGPFVEAVAMGLALYACAVAAGVALAIWRTRRSRLFALAVLGVDVLGTIFTLTRAVWLATVASTVIALAASPTTRRYLTPAVAFGAMALACAMLLVPGFAQHAEERSNDRNPVNDRLVTDAAAIRAVQAQPLFGVGWGRWLDVNTDYIENGPNYPISPNAAKIEIHNVWLSNAAQLGLIGVALWMGALGAALAAALVRPGPADLDPWRLGLIALVVHFAIVGSFGPLSYAFPNLLLWLWAGVTAIGHTSSALPDNTGLPDDSEARDRQIDLTARDAALA